MSNKYYIIIHSYIRRGKVIMKINEKCKQILHKQNNNIYDFIIWACCLIKIKLHNSKKDFMLINYFKRTSYPNVVFVLRTHNYRANFTFRIIHFTLSYYSYLISKGIILFWNFNIRIKHITHVVLFWHFYFKASYVYFKEIYLKIFLYILKWS